MKYYLQKSFTGVLPMEYAIDDPEINKDAVNDGYTFGMTYDDWLAGAWILLSAEQEAFWQANATASAAEIIDMELVPPAPLPTLQELKDGAISMVESGATGKLNSLYPAHEMLSMAYSTTADELDQAVYFDGFEAAKDAIGTLVEAAVAAIGAAVDADGINGAVSLFNDAISEL